MDKAEKDNAIARDPLPKLRATLISEGHAAESDLDAMEAEIEKLIDEAVQFAFDSPYPDVRELCHDVYAEELRS
jgi:pyruvate dehydrogenase E1 component alpha subunit